MAKGKDAKKKEKKEPAKTQKEKKEEKRLKKSKQKLKTPSWLCVSIKQQKLVKFS